MADYSIGDRVEVKWQAELFDAAVTKVRLSGKVDVKYDIDGSAGIFLTAKDHGLKLLGNEEKNGGGGKKKKVCSVGGCSNKVQVRGLCDHHRRKPCSVDGCTTKAKARGLCQKHGGGLGECLREGCTTPAVKKGGLCGKHRVKRSCADLDCDTPQVLGRFVCIKHGAYGYCTTDACANGAFTTRGKCMKHDSKPVACSTEGCSTKAKSKSRGVCGKHGTKTICSFNNCTTAAQLEAGAASTAVARKYARRKAAPLVHNHVVSVANMVRMERASLKDAPLTQSLHQRIASNTAAERRSRAPWRDAPAPLNARVSAQSTAVVQANACLAAAPTRWWETSGRPANGTVA